MPRAERRTDLNEKRPTLFLKVWTTDGKSHDLPRFTTEVEIVVMVSNSDSKSTIRYSFPVLSNGSHSDGEDTGNDLVRPGLNLGLNA